MSSSNDEKSIIENVTPSTFSVGKTPFNLWITFLVSDEMALCII
ncbi:hypothetical protein PROSTU_01957 [Providencia stuartii ATCC 25827]|uniref:Uncharacterized protein n=1 Tax=Providencia stuartii ATCC 25827 TaxID=471874 RepID=A0AA86YHW8_PROST|nr:hypothetical protein PROSTU_01957 [Providencia stuartii ATCC 25827]